MIFQNKPVSVPQYDVTKILNVGALDILTMVKIK